MKYPYVLGVQNASVRAKMDTEQFALSEILLDKRFDLRLSFEEMASVAGFKDSEYIHLEYGEPFILTETYLLAIENIERYEGGL